MVKTYCTYLMLFLLCASATSQNMQILYGFDQLPQTLMLNPGAVVDYDKHFGVPLLSNVYAVAGSSSRDINYNNLKEGTEDSGDIIRNLHDLGLNDNEIFLFHQEVELLNAGLRLKNPKYYLSFGMYQQTDGFSSYPKDFGNIFFNGDDQDQNGSPEFGEDYTASHVNTVFELVGVFHAGISKRVNEKLNIGGRLKILSGSLGLETTNNEGTYHLGYDPLSNEPYLHNFEEINVRMNTAGLLDSFDLSEDVGSTKELIAGLFFMNGSLGAAIDLGFTYKHSKELSFTGSLLDLGIMSFQHKLTTLDFEDAQIASDDYYDPSGNELDYWTTKYLSNELPLITGEEKFSYSRSPKLNASVRYDKRRKVKQPNSAFRNVRADLLSDYLTTSFGMQIYTAFRPKYPVWAVTAFYSRELNKYLSLKATYTVDKFSFYNIGFGLSTHIKSFNFYATIDNLVALPSIKNSNYQSFQFGMNFIFK
ncbi:DUF5723 family protein [Lutimonas halocynthiae]|uniref:DUF5723 family protein n=1 Tax=Lutimonas halocynthiae TaxID=1446477 RepID=UPI0025B4A8D9|nr:DUF5723 family protein [Lutimonas halocynthiae]MDN3642178.1 DUF5723 family protein [Lutimonas halocynthiae]